MNNFLLNIIEFFTYPYRMAIRYIAHLQSVLSAPDNEGNNSSNGNITAPTYYNPNDSSCTRLWRLSVNKCNLFLINELKLYENDRTKLNIVQDRKQDITVRRAIPMKTRITGGHRISTGRTLGFNSNMSDNSFKTKYSII